MKLSEVEQLPWQDDFESSNIARVAHVVDDAALSLGTLYVEFNGSQRIYAYTAVPAEAVEEMVAAESVGGYFNGEIKGSYEYERVQVTPA
jgi:KTSC domain